MSYGDPSCLDSNASWMLSAGRTPCDVLGSLVRVCSTTAAVQHLSADVSCAALGTNSTSPCCCSTVTYALTAACWVCQTSQSPNQLMSYTRWFSGCSSSLNGSLSSVITSAQISIPSWALIQPSATDTTWNVSRAQLAANSALAANSTSSSASSSPIPTTTPPPNRPKPPSYIPIAMCAAVVLVLLLGMAVWLYRRRNRVSPSSRPPPDFEIDGATTNLLPKPPTGPRSWAWWTRRLARSRSNAGGDPSKIDAWRYPFEYTPVSVGSSTSGSRRGVYYDPYLPRDTLAPRPSVDTLRGQPQPQGSSGTLAQRYPTPTGYSTSSLVPGPGYTNLAGYSPQSTQRAQQSMPPGYTPAPLPGPHTYPYGVPSTSTSSPLSPQPARHPRHAHTHTFELRLSPEEYERLRSMYPEIRVRTRRRRRRDREAGSGSEAEPSRGAPRPRSWSVPPGETRPAVEAEDDEYTGRPRNGVELREKYDSHARRRGVTESGSDTRPGWRMDTGEAATSGRGRERERLRAVDGGISLMGGPPRR